jgi:micrococcal nuclease
MSEFAKPNYVYRACLINIVDGDTIDVDIDVGFHTTMRKRLRFLDINTFETRGPEREKGLLAKARATEILEAADRIYVQTKMDAEGKYGRLLAWVWCEKDGELMNLNNQLLLEGHAVKY